MSHHHDHRKAYAIIWMMLLLLTAVTVWTAYHNFGVFNIVVAMGIASIKASLVVLFFMHLKDDHRLNQVVFASAFVFLLIFIGLTLSDELFRSVEIQAKVDAIAKPAGSEAATHEKLRLSSPELLAKGKEIFAVQCVTCHGAEGKGDGPAATALKPPPRNFTSGEWGKGGAPTHVFKTVSEGIAETGMAPFASLPVEDRWAVVHYLRTFAPNPPSDTPETLAASGLFAAGGETAQAPTPKIPVDFAIDRLVEEAK